jgi:hypothetical protein
MEVGVDAVAPDVRGKWPLRPPWRDFADEGLSRGKRMG